MSSFIQDLNGLTITTVSVIAAPFLFRRNDATWKSVNDVNTQERYVRNRKTLEQVHLLFTFYCKVDIYPGEFI
jgi:hypothetical protein